MQSQPEIHSEPGQHLQRDDEAALLLGVEDSALLLGIGRTKTFELISTGMLPSVQIGRRRLVRRADLEGFVTSLSSAQSNGRGP